MSQSREGIDSKIEALLRLVCRHHSTMVKNVQAQAVESYQTPVSRNRQDLQSDDNEVRDFKNSSKS